APLVHRERGRHDAAARVRDAERLERALHGAVLAEPPVQRDERARVAVALELPQVALARVERVRVDALLAQRAEDAVARHQRNLALRRGSAEQDSDLAEVARRHRTASPTTRTSGSSVTPKRACTVSRACAISASM